MQDHPSHHPQSTIKNAIEYGRVFLKSSVSQSQFEALLLLQHATSKNKEYLIAHNEDSLDEQTYEIYLHYLSRRKNGEPLAYIQQEKEFWSLPIHVEEEILIPRPETELLIESALTILKENKTAKILDLGTGSGCIALALASELPNAHIFACDNSNHCINVASHNANTLDIKNVRFIHSDWFQSISEDEFDLIVSNPPYIDNKDPDIEEFVRKYEPGSALFADDDGLSCLFHIIEHSSNYLNETGHLILEHGYQQGNDVRTQLEKFTFCKINTLKDFQQLERVTTGMIK